MLSVNISVRVGQTGRIMKIQILMYCYEILLYARLQTGRIMVW